MWSTEDHPYGLVYDYMANLDLRQYLQSGPKVGRLTLVPLLCTHDLPAV